MRGQILGAVLVTAATLTNVALAQDVAQKLETDPVARACKALAEQGDETAQRHYEHIRAQLEATAETGDQGPEGEAVRDFQQTMRKAAEARAWCGAIPLQTSSEAPAQTDDPDIPKEWIRQSLLQRFEARNCESVLSDQSEGNTYKQCRRMRRQLDEWANYYK